MYKEKIKDALKGFSTDDLKDIHKYIDEILKDRVDSSPQEGE